MKNEENDVFLTPLELMVESINHSNRLSFDKEEIIVTDEFYADLYSEYFDLISDDEYNKLRLLARLKGQTVHHDYWSDEFLKYQIKKKKLNKVVSI